MPCPALHCTALHCTALHCTALPCRTLPCVAVHCRALPFAFNPIQLASSADVGAAYPWVLESYSTGTRLGTPAGTDAPQLLNWYSTWYSRRDGTDPPHRYFDVTSIAPTCLARGGSLAVTVRGKNLGCFEKGVCRFWTAGGRGT
jgi:hypothetical protein